MLHTLVLSIDEVIEEYNMSKTLKQILKEKQDLAKSYQNKYSERGELNEDETVEYWFTAGVEEAINWTLSQIENIEKKFAVGNAIGNKSSDYSFIIGEIILLLILCLTIGVLLWRGR